MCQASAKLVSLLRIDVCVNGYDEDVRGFAGICIGIYIGNWALDRQLTLFVRVRTVYHPHEFFSSESSRFESMVRYLFRVSISQFSVLFSVLRFSFLIGASVGLQVGQRCHILSNSSNYDLVSSV